VQQRRFAKLLANEGYRVTGHSAPFTAQSLAGMDLLIISNATAPDGAESAFTDAAIAAVEAWVGKGGSLLLIADHAPFAGAAAKLGTAFGVSFRDGYAIEMASQGKDLFRRGAGLAARMGFGAEGAEQNQRFALNLMHWLSRRRGY
jgi:hypothetical protein